MELTAGERTYFLITCPRCGKGTCKRIDGLASEQRMYCSSPTCRAVIDLKVPQRQQLFELLVDHAAHIDELLGKAGSPD
jgi:hypothetical protein